MKLPVNVRSCLCEAARLDLPFAIWRRPGGQSYEAVVSCGPLTNRPVFSQAEPETFFAINRFDAAAPNTADTILADLIIRGAEISFRDGGTFAARPSSRLQQMLAAAAGRADATALRAKNGAEPPAQTSEAGYKALVSAAVDEIRAGGFSKVVTSRTELRALPEDHDLLTLLERLAEKLSNAFVSLVCLPGNGAWLVGTPETLLSFRDGIVNTIALAGTQWQDEVDLREVRWSDKLIEEQALVSHYIRSAFQGEGIAEFTEQGPHSVRAANLVHLRSDFSAVLRDDPACKLSGLLSALHPTSAVCGMPKEPALEFLRRNEGYDRSYYTGYLGPVNFDGATDLFVNLRTAQIIGDRIYLYVGGGIVQYSDPAVEWQETVEKTKTVGSIF